MNLSNLHPAAGSKHSDAFRVGRGHGSGNGKTAGRGQKGQKSRSGGKVRVGFEGGQMPLYRRLPKRGFTCINSKKIIAINVSELERFEADSVVTIDTLIESGLVKNTFDGVKILGNGELSKKLTVQVNAFSKSAVAKIEAAGGKAERRGEAKKPQSRWASGGASPKKGREQNHSGNNHSDRRGSSGTHSGKRKGRRS